MTNPNKRRGDRFENLIRDHCRTHGFPHAEKTRAGYERDHGDIHPCGNRDVVLQAKAVARMDLPAWLAQLADQIRHAGARHGALVVKRRQHGPGSAYAVVELDAYLELLRAAGYGADTTETDTTRTPTPTQSGPESV